MNCPYCGAKDFIQDVVFRHAENYGGSTSNLPCKSCKQIVSVTTQVKIIVTDVRRSEKESDW